MQLHRVRLATQGKHGSLKSGSGFTFASGAGVKCGTSANYGCHSAMQEVEHFRPEAKLVNFTDVKALVHDVFRLCSC